VKPIITKIICKEDQNPRPPGKWNREKSEVYINQCENRQYQGFGKQSNKNISQTHCNRRSRIFKGVASHLFFTRDDNLDDQCQYKKRDGIMDKIW